MESSKAAQCHQSIGDFIPAYCLFPHKRSTAEVWNRRGREPDNLVVQVGTLLASARQPHMRNQRGAFRSAQKIVAPAILRMRAGNGGRK